MKRSPLNRTLSCQFEETDVATTILSTNRKLTVRPEIVAELMAKAFALAAD